jgi:hypothetical protein
MAIKGAGLLLAALIFGCLASTAGAGGINRRVVIAVAENDPRDFNVLESSVHAQLSDFGTDVFLIRRNTVAGEGAGGWQVLSREVSGETRESGVGVVALRGAVARTGADGPGECFGAGKCRGPGAERRPRPRTPGGGHLSIRNTGDVATGSGYLWVMEITNSTSARSIGKMAVR